MITDHKFKTLLLIDALFHFFKTSTIAVCSHRNTNNSERNRGKSTK